MKQLVIGLMSGTSLDGIDVALCEIEEADGIQSVTLIQAATYPYSSSLERRIRQLLDANTYTAPLTSSVHFELGVEYASVVEQFLATTSYTKEHIELIACHGQTIYHINDEAGYHPSSLQLGDGSVLSTLTGIPVVANFRNADIAVGGTGAPLVPYADYILFQNEAQTIALHNIGGISNLTLIPNGGTLADLVAFDTGPGNVLINEAMSQLFGQSMDEDGRIAAQGTVQENIVSAILSHPYFVKQPPKSTGRELFGKDYVQQLLSTFSHHTKEDVVASITEATARSIIQAYQEWILPDHPSLVIYVSGGGVHNKYLMKKVQDGLPGIRVANLMDTGIHPDFKEAIAFAILGHETMHHRPSNVPHATGASRPVVLGQISIPLKEE